eukprot:jgi/Mesvir1/23799/Mv10612-RA.1
MIRSAALRAAAGGKSKPKPAASDHAENSDELTDEKSMTAEKLLFEVDMLVNTYKLSRRLIAFLLQLVIYIAILFLQRDVKDSHILEEMVEYELVGRPTPDGVAFTDILTADELWEWTDQLFIPLLYDQEYYNGDPMEEALLHTIGYQTKFIGGVRMRQTRYAVNGSACYRSQYDEIGLHCRSGSSMEPFGMNDAPLNTPAFEWRCDPRDDYCGFFMDLDLGGETIEAEVEEVEYLKRGLWVDFLTSSVALDAILYCHNLKMWVVVELRLLFGVAGRIEPEYDVRVLQLDPYNFEVASNRVRLFLEILYVLLVAYFFVVIVYDFAITSRFNPRIYVAQMGGLTMTLLELTGIGLSLASIFLWAVFIRQDERREVMTHYPFHEKYVNLWKVVEWEDKWVSVTCINLLIQTMRSLKFFQVTRGGARLIRSVATAVPEVASFIPVYVTIMLGYAFAGYFLFGVRLVEWSDLESAIFRVYEINYGLYDTDTLYTEGKPKFVVALYLYSGTLIIVVMLLNVFLAIVMSTWDSLSQMDEENKARLHKSTWGDMLALLRLRSREVMSLEAQLGVTLSEEEQVVTYELLIQLLTQHVEPGAVSSAEPASKASYLARAQKAGKEVQGVFTAITRGTAEAVATLLFGPEESGDGARADSRPGAGKHLKKGAVYPQGGHDSLAVEVDSPGLLSPSMKPMLAGFNVEDSSGAKRM